MQRAGEGRILELRPDRRPPTVTRATIRGKHFVADDAVFFPRGCTYGAFRPDALGREFTDVHQIDHDFELMAAWGFTAVRIPHTVPPIGLLDAASHHGLRVMVGLSAEQHVGYLADGGGPNIERLVREKVRDIASHPAVLCYALGNEIPAPSARWLGRRKIERYLHRLADVVRTEDPEAVVTYVNFPTTEYLDLSFLDVLSFNVYLEERERLEAYLARLQNLAGDRPLLLTEVGLDTLRNGEAAQAASLAWQLRTAFAGGCAGAFVFSWTDEWWRAGEQVEDWAFGLTDRERQPKLALSTVSETFESIPFETAVDWPRVSVVVCAYNAEPTIAECLEGVGALEYPDLEVIVVDDGSTDATATIAGRYDVKMISTPNQGLSAARNVGLEAATGEVIAYLDSDAWPEPLWLQYLVGTLIATGTAGVGGPNVGPPGDRFVARCVAASPGGPIHVLLDDTTAEHVPGCNMAFWRTALEELGGFDARFAAAGDDVDLCWRIQDRGWRIGFSPAALVWHHRRGSVRGYLKQQRGYGRAEALLEAKWPERYNRLGHVSWAGSVYGPGRIRRWIRPVRIYHGTWGTAPFQSVYERGPTVLSALPSTPEWWLAVAGLLLVSALGALWTPLLAALPIAGALTVAGLVSAVVATRRASPAHPPAALLTAALHVLQPLARLAGRLRGGLRPWRHRSSATWRLPIHRDLGRWTETWRDGPGRLHDAAGRMRAGGATVQLTDEHDGRWDLEVRTGQLASARMLLVAEDHAEGAQYVRYRVGARVSFVALALIAALAALAAGAAWFGAWPAVPALAAVAAALAAGVVRATGTAIGAVLDAVDAATPWNEHSRGR